MINGHGDDLYRYAGKVHMNFSSNIDASARLQPLMAHLTHCLNSIRNYPEPSPDSLEQAIARKLGVAARHVLAANGATECIYLLAQHLAADATGKPLRHAIVQPTFSEYADACKLYGNSVVGVDGQSLWQTGFLQQIDVCWLCNPNNPTGRMFAVNHLLQLIDANPRTLFIVDQSYEDYVAQPVVAAKQVAQRSNVVALHSMTKRYCVPGLRLGYMVASPQLIAQIKAHRYPWSMGALSLHAGMFLVNQAEAVLGGVEQRLAEARRLAQLLAAIPTLQVISSATTFFLVRIDCATAAQLKQWLIDHYGILIRDASNFEGLDNHCFRVASQTSLQNDTLVCAVKAFVAQTKA